MRFAKRRPLRTNRRVKRKLRFRSRPAKRRRLAAKVGRRVRAKVNATGRVLSPMKWISTPYCDFKQLTMVSSGLPQGSTSVIWRANSIYDPLWAASGTFNQKSAMFNYMTTLYNHWCVVASSIKVSIKQAAFGYSGGAVAWKPIVFMLRLDDDATTTPSAWTDAATDPNVTYKTHFYESDTHQGLTLKQSFSTAKWFHNSTPWKTPSLCGDVSTNPTEAAYYVLQWQNKTMVDDSSVPPAVYVNVRIHYKVVFFEPRDIQDLPSAMAMVQN